MKFLDLAIGDLFQFLNGQYTYKKVGERNGMPMCTRRSDLVEISPETEIVNLASSAYSRDREENIPDFDQLIWEIECQMAE